MSERVAQVTFFVNIIITHFLTAITIALRRFGLNDGYRPPRGGGRINLMIDLAGKIHSPTVWDQVKSAAHEVP
jgi:hypothetical protein